MPVSNVQTAQLGVVPLLKAWRGQFSAREYDVLVV